MIPAYLMGTEPSWSLSRFESWGILGRSQKSVLIKGGPEASRRGKEDPDAEFLNQLTCFP